jgi:hypothetical protein
VSNQAKPSIFDYINRCYGLSVAIGDRAKTQQGDFGTVRGTQSGARASGHYVVLDLDDGRRSGPYHPRDLEYAPSDDPRLSVAAGASMGT